MFGGLAFMVNTHMACGLVGDDLMVRVGKDNHDAAITAGATQEATALRAALVAKPALRASCRHR